MTEANVGDDDDDENTIHLQLALKYLGQMIKQKLNLKLYLESLFKII